MKTVSETLYCKLPSTNNERISKVTNLMKRSCFLLILLLAIQPVFSQTASTIFDKTYSFVQQRVYELEKTGFVITDYSMTTDWGVESRLNEFSGDSVFIEAYIFTNYDLYQQDKNLSISRSNNFKWESIITKITYNKSRFDGKSGMFKFQWKTSFKVSEINYLGKVSLFPLLEGFKDEGIVETPEYNIGVVLVYGRSKRSK
jgi:hypothetical protein